MLLYGREEEDALLWSKCGRFNTLSDYQFLVVIEAFLFHVGGIWVSRLFPRFSLSLSLMDHDLSVVSRFLSLTIFMSTGVACVRKIL